MDLESPYERLTDGLRTRNWRTSSPEIVNVFQKRTCENSCARRISDNRDKSRQEPRHSETPRRCPCSRVRSMNADRDRKLSTRDQGAFGGSTDSVYALVVRTSRTRARRVLAKGTFSLEDRDDLAQEG